MKSPKSLSIVRMGRRIRKTYVWQIVLKLIQRRRLFILIVSENASVWVYNSTHGNVLALSYVYIQITSKCLYTNVVVLYIFYKELNPISKNYWMNFMLWSHYMKIIFIFAMICHCFHEILRNYVVRKKHYTLQSILMGYLVEYYFEKTFFPFVFIFSLGSYRIKNKFVQVNEYFHQLKRSQLHAQFVCLLQSEKSHFVS